MRLPDIQHDGGGLAREGIHQRRGVDLLNPGARLAYLVLPRGHLHRFVPVLQDRGGRERVAGRPDLVNRPRQHPLAGATRPPPAGRPGARGGGSGTGARFFATFEDDRNGVGPARLSDHTVPDDANTARPDDAAPLELLERVQRAHDDLVSQLERRIIGQRGMIEELLVALLARGHAMFVGVPGLAKTLLVRSLADATALSFGRVQFTPDLMPADITGTEILDVDPATGAHLPLREGTRLRASAPRRRDQPHPAQDQAALLQAMQEGRPRGGASHPLRPFTSSPPATSSSRRAPTPCPRRSSSVHARDRGALSRPITRGRHRHARSARVSIAGSCLHEATLASLQDFVASIPCRAQWSRPSPTSPAPPGPARPSPHPGARAAPVGGRSTRGTAAGAACRARAALHGRPAVVTEDVAAPAPVVLAHRVVPSFAAEARKLGRVTSSPRSSAPSHPLISPSGARAGGASSRRPPVPGETEPVHLPAGARAGPWPPPDRLKGSRQGLRGVSTYAAGDEPREIDRRATARLERVMIRQTGESVA